VSDPFRIEQELTPADLELAIALHAEATRRVWIRRLYGGVWMLTGVLTAAIGPVWLGVAAVLYGWVLLTGALERWARHRRLRHNVQRLGELALDITPDGMALEAADARSEIRWEHWACSLFLDDRVVLVDRARPAGLFPLLRSGLTEPGRWRELTVLVASHVAAHPRSPRRPRVPVL
jgi:hypothetical protein